jgi:hypothetical protein
LNKVAQFEATARAELFGETANRLGLPDSLVEKDFWVCWMLDQLFSIDYAMLGFTGTSDPHAESLSRTKQQALLQKMLDDCRRYIRGEFLDSLRGRCREVLGSEEKGGWKLSVDAQSPDFVRFEYPRAARQQFAYVVPQVILELGTHAEFIPRGEFTIRSFAAAEFPSVFAKPDVPVTSLLAKRTFWEKATILHAEFHRPVDKPMPARYSRHYYDVATMAQGAVKKEALDDLPLLSAVVRHKQIFYPSAWAQFPLAVPGTFRIVPPQARVKALRQDYREMGVMIFGEAPPFEKILEALLGLEAELNSTSGR